MNFPVFKTKTPGVSERFNLNDPEERKRYFALKAGGEIAKIKKYLEGGNTFVGFLLGKKNSGKGTYSKLFMEAVGAEHVGHVSVGDIVRDIHTCVEKGGEEKDRCFAFLKKNYRGFHGVEDLEDLILGRNQSSLISSELIVALVKYEISKRPRKAIFIDGFPRAMDQIGYSLYLKEMIGYREDPDFLVFISLPNTVLAERIKYRVVCPICKVPRNTKLLATKEVGWDAEKKEFFLMCDNPPCNHTRMVPKEGDELGIEPIKARLEADEKIMEELLKLHGIPKVYLRNAVPVSSIAEYVDDYELTPGYSYELEEGGKVKILETPWTVKDDEGVDSYSLLPPAIVVSMIKQIANVLEL